MFSHYCDEMYFFCTFFLFQGDTTSISQCNSMAILSSAGGRKMIKYQKTVARIILQNLYGNEATKYVACLG